MIKKQHPFIEGELPQKKRILVAFGDVSGFSNWSRRTEDDGEHFNRFMRPLSKSYSSLRDELTIVKKDGDGIMIVVEVEKGKEEETALRVLRKCVSILQHTKRIIRSLRHPKPQGFRVRLIGGPAWKWREADEPYDYYGKTVNTAANLLNVAKGVPFVVHATFLDMVHPRALKRIGVSVRRLSTQPPAEKIDSEDLELLFCLTYKSCNGCRVCFSKARRKSRPT